MLEGFKDKYTEIDYLKDLVTTPEIEKGINTVFKLKKGFLKCIQDDIVTSLGRLIYNAVMVEFVNDGDLPYINKDITIGDYADILAEHIRDKSDVVERLKRLTQAQIFLNQIIPYVVQTQHEKLLVPPEGLEEYRKKVEIDMEKRHGKDWRDVVLYVSEYEEILTEYTKKIFKPLVDKNVTMSYGKKVYVAIKKVYVNFGNTNSMTGDVKAIMGTLEEGLDLTPENFTKLVNDIRYASGSRGKDTQLGGVIAYILTRSTHQYMVTMEDCKTTATKKMTVENMKMLSGSYKMVGNKPVKITPDNTKVGDTINLRSVRYCKTDDKNIYCKICSGDGVTKNMIPLMTAGMGGIYLNILMKAMHDSAIHNALIDLDDMFT